MANATAGAAPAWEDLANEPYVPPPASWLALTEAQRAMVEIISLRFSRRLLRRAPIGDGHGVMVLPGFLGGDGYNRALRRFLRGRHYGAHGWGLGRNLGPREGVLDALRARLVDLSERYEGAVSLVGHSLGGIFARELARDMPERVRQVISLGSPFGSGRMTASLPARLFVSLNPVDELPLDPGRLPQAPPVPTTTIYSRGDGIVNWETTVQVNGHSETQNVEVRGSHCGMTLNPSIWFLVAERLAQPEGQWQPFSVEGWRQLLYPRAHD